MQAELLSRLSEIPDFSTVPPAQLEWMVSKGELIRWADGEIVFKPGDQINHMRVILQGHVNVFFDQGGSRRFFDVIEEREITGVLPYSRMKGAMAQGIASGETVAFQLHREHFPEMIRTQYELTEVLVHNMTDRVRYTLKQQQINDKMMSLGKLSAGLAHELNNPSAAVIRSANELKKHLGHLPQRFKAVIRIQTTAETVDAVNDLLFERIRNKGTSILSLSERTHREDRLNDWLSDNGVDEPFMLAESFAEYSITIDDLERLKLILRPEDLNAVLDWLHQMLTTERLVSEIDEASRRINDLVTSIKSYTHMDQAREKERADVHVGLRNTLTMLNHKIRKNGVTVKEEYEPGLPEPLIYVSAMNQVWTNLIDNALDAMEGRPGSVLEVRTQRDREFIRVRIIDNGPGIPPEIQDKIFDSFFTTKPVGKGTGLGLEMVRQIINQHNGKIDVTSVPGGTEFNVCFPIE